MDHGIGGFTPQAGDHGAGSGLELFNKIQADNMFDSFNVVPIRPLNAINVSTTDQGGPYKFEIGSPSCRDFFSLKSLRLDMKIRIVRADGTPLLAADNDQISTTNCFAHA